MYEDVDGKIESQSKSSHLVIVNILSPMFIVPVILLSLMKYALHHTNQTFELLYPAS